MFTLGNERKDNHLTYKATRHKGQTINDPVEVSLNLQGLNSLSDPVYQTIGTVDSKGTLRIQYGLNLNQPRLDIGYETLVWLLSASVNPSFEMPNNLQIMSYLSPTLTASSLRSVQSVGGFSISKPSRTTPPTIRANQHIICSPVSEAWLPRRPSRK